MTENSTLRITEIFHSLQGEASTVGRPTVFVRLTGCPLRCQYCDTAYAFSGGSMMSLKEILAEVRSQNCDLVTVTGGEPLAQPECTALLSELAEQGYAVSLETSGAMPIAGIDSRISIVLDLKTPGSMECEKNDYSNITELRKHDQVKFVICNRGDYEWARSKIIEFGLVERVQEVLLSPSHGVLPTADLASWILSDGLRVRLQMQMHKLIWGDKPGH